MATLSNDHAVEPARTWSPSPAEETEVTLECTEDRFGALAHPLPAPTAEAQRSGFPGAREAGNCAKRATCGTIEPDDMRATLERVDAGPVRRAPGGPAAGGEVEIAPSALERPTQDHLQQCRVDPYGPGGAPRRAELGRD
ncbi:MAG: hypothetical protein R3E96_08240 [Planctomycetota bacterium]